MYTYGIFNKQKKISIFIFLLHLLPIYLYGLRLYYTIFYKFLDKYTV